MAKAGIASRSGVLLERLGAPRRIMRTEAFSECADVCNRACANPCIPGYSSNLRIARPLGIYSETLRSLISTSSQTAPFLSFSLRLAGTNYREKLAHSGRKWLRSRQDSGVIQAIEGLIGRSGKQSDERFGAAAKEWLAFGAYCYHRRRLRVEPTVARQWFARLSASENHQVIWNSVG